MLDVEEYGCSVLIQVLRFIDTPVCILKTVLQLRGGTIRQRFNSFWSREQRFSLPWSNWPRWAVCMALYMLNLWNRLYPVCFSRVYQVKCWWNLGRTKRLMFPAIMCAASGYIQLLMATCRRLRTKLALVFVKYSAILITAVVRIAVISQWRTRGLHLTVKYSKCGGQRLSAV